MLALWEHYWLSGFWATAAHSSLARCPTYRATFSAEGGSDRKTSSGKLWSRAAPTCSCAIFQRILWIRKHPLQQPWDGPPQHQLSFLTLELFWAFRLHLFVFNSSFYMKNESPTEVHYFKYVHLSNSIINGSHLHDFISKCFLFIHNYWMEQQASAGSHTHTQGFKLVKWSRCWHDPVCGDETEAVQAAGGYDDKGGMWNITLGL